MLPRCIFFFILWVSRIPEVSRLRESLDVVYCYPLNELLMKYLHWHVREKKSWERWLTTYFLVLLLCATYVICPVLICYVSCRMEYLACKSKTNASLVIISCVAWYMLDIVRSLLNPVVIEPNLIQILQNSFENSSCRSVLKDWNGFGWNTLNEWRDT